LRVADPVFSPSLRFHEEVVASLPSENVKTPSPPVAQLANVVEEALFRIRKFAAAKGRIRPALPEFSSVGVYPHAIPSGFFEYSQYG
jgi:hypothetical protein